MTLRSIALTALVGLGVWYWVKSREIKDVALQAASRHCEELALIFLDQSVSLAGMKIGRDARGQLCIVRTFNFDFSSTGEDRYQGQVHVEGRRISRIWLAPHRID
jgi:Protein of unknown function (DUF3301)